MTRWTARRKAAIVEAVRDGYMSAAQAIADYGLTLEEFVGWERNHAARGIAGLRTTIKQNRGGS